jgi:hypothetical protein
MSGKADRTAVTYALYGMVQCSPIWLSEDFIKHGWTLKLRGKVDNIVISCHIPYNDLAPIP